VFELQNRRGVLFHFRRSMTPSPVSGIVSVGLLRRRNGATVGRFHTHVRGWSDSLERLTDSSLCILRADCVLVNMTLDRCSAAEHLSCRVGSGAYARAAP
jgi:hypothetical protein